MGTKQVVVLRIGSRICIARLSQNKIRFLIAVHGHVVWLVEVVLLSVKEHNTKGIFARNAVFTSNALSLADGDVTKRKSDPCSSTKSEHDPIINRNTEPPVIVCQ